MRFFRLYATCEKRKMIVFANVLKYMDGAFSVKAVGEHTLEVGFWEGWEKADEFVRWLAGRLGAKILLAVQEEKDIEVAERAH